MIQRSPLIGQKENVNFMSWLQWINKVNNQIDKFLSIIFFTSMRFNQEANFLSKEVFGPVDVFAHFEDCMDEVRIDAKSALFF